MTRSTISIDESTKMRFAEFHRRMGFQNHSMALDYLLDMAEHNSNISEENTERLEAIMDKYNYSLNEVLRYLLELRDIILAV
ncbi:MAG: hypothetical protein PHU95_01165 [Candidatus Thermoplasmatota archaeon]|nr:hypothetical protein [Candidatus Thermoplasmatota archaeon]MDD5778045.1 hypothetical protein [Candidatus Thermoplasmatota archaeon]